jgi:hypothetical protein
LPCFMTCGKAERGSIAGDVKVSTPRGMS